jgi:hypothetical protein
MRYLGSMRSMRYLGSMRSMQNLGSMRSMRYLGSERYLGSMRYLGFYFYKNLNPNNPCSAAMLRKRTPPCEQPYIASWSLGLCSPMPRACALLCLLRAACELHAMVLASLCTDALTCLA